jgi:hypothetical protein
VQQHTVLERPYTSYFLTHITNDGTDSWLTMREAIQYIKNHPDSLVYQHIFFQEKVKFQYPPTSLLFLEPFSSLSFLRLLEVVNFLGWISVWLIGYLSYRIFRKTYRQLQPTARVSRKVQFLWLLLFVGLAITFYPFMRSWRLGQTQTFLILLFATSVYCLISDRKVLAGVGIGLICAIKPPLALLAVWGALRRQWLFVAGMVGTGIFILLLSIVFYGWHNHIDYLAVISYIGKRGEVYYPNQTVNGLLNRLFETGSSTEWAPNEFPAYHPVVYTITIITSAGLIIAALLPATKQEARFVSVLLIDFFVAALSFTLSAPVAWEHHYGIVFPMLAVILAYNLNRNTARWEWMLLALSYFLLSNLLEITHRWPDAPGNIFQSYVFFSVVLLLGYFYWLRRTWYISYVSQAVAAPKETENTTKPV